jgi:hypothetical protein
MARLFRKCVVVSTVTEDTLPDRMASTYTFELAKASEFGYTSNKLPVFTTASSVRVMHGGDPVGCFTLEVEYQYVIPGYNPPKEERLFLLFGSQVAFYDRLQEVFQERYGERGRWLVPHFEEVHQWEGKVVQVADPVVPRGL